MTEMKWTRGSMGPALKRAKKSLGFLRHAALAGRWTRSRRAVHASAVGAMAVSPNCWKLYMQAVDRAWSKTVSCRTPCHPQQQLEAPRKKRHRHYRSGASKRRGNLTAKAVERTWRKTKKGRALATKLKNTYRPTTRGRAARHRETAERGRNRPSC